MRLPALNDEKKRFKIPTIRKNRYYLDTQVSGSDEVPSEEVMRRLEAELGSFASHEAIMNPAIQDKILLSSSAVNMSLRELSDVHSEDMMDPSDFVSVVQNSQNCMKKPRISDSDELISDNVIRRLEAKIGSFFTVRRP